MRETDWLLLVTRESSRSRAYVVCLVFSDCGHGSWSELTKRFRDHSDGFNTLIAVDSFVAKEVDGQLAINSPVICGSLRRLHH